MNDYNKPRSVIPTGATPPQAEQDPERGRPDALAPEARMIDEQQAAPVAPDDAPAQVTEAVSTTGDAGASPTDTVARAAPPEWRDRWAVTEHGLESRQTINGQPINYRIEKERLLHQWPGKPGVSNWAMQLADKSWVDDPDAMIEAVKHAIFEHHPGQTVIDAALTASAARARWERKQRDTPAIAPDDYIEWKPGDSVHRRAAGHQRCAGDDHWIDAYPAKHRSLLLKDGIPPAAHPRADEFNRRLIGLAGDGVTGAALDAAIEALLDDVFGDGPPEDGPVADLGDYVIKPVALDNRSRE